MRMITVMDISRQFILVNSLSSVHLKYLPSKINLRPFLCWGVMGLQFLNQGRERERKRARESKLTENLQAGFIPDILLDLFGCLF